MSEKDSVSSQDIPAVLRALGTLALAAATAVAIKWFISRDKTGKSEEEYSKFHCNQVPIEDGQSSRDDPKADEETLENNKMEPQVSDKQAMMALALDCYSHGLLKNVLDTSCPYSVYVNEDGACLTDQKRLLGDVSPESYEPSNVASPHRTIHNPWGDSVSNSGLPAVIVDDTTNDNQEQLFPSCLPQTYDKTSYERSQDQQLNTGTSSSNGECNDDINVKYLECQSQTTAHYNLGSATCAKHKTVDMGLIEDLYNVDSCENNENLNGDPEMNASDHTNLLVENRDNIYASLSGINPEGNTNLHLSNRGNLMRAIVPGFPESQENINASKSAYSPHSPKVLTRCLNTKQHTIYTTYNIKDIFQTVDMIQEAKLTTITISSKDTTLKNTPCKSHSQGEKCHIQGNNHVTCTQQSSVEHKIYMTSEERLNQTDKSLTSSCMSSIPASAQVPEEHVTAGETNMELLSSGDTLHYNSNGKYDDQAAGGFPNHVELLCLPKADGMDEMKSKSTVYHHTNHVLQWNTTTIYNSTENIDLMYPLHSHAPESSITPLIEKDEGQLLLGNNVSLSSEKSIPAYKEKECNNLDTDVESSFKGFTPVPSTMTGNLLCHPSSLNTFNSTLVTKTETQIIESTSDRQDKGVIYKQHKNNANSLTNDKEEVNSCMVITNEYISRCQKQTDTNKFSCSFGEHQNSSPVTPDEESSCRSRLPCIDNQNASYVMMDMSKGELKYQQSIQAIKKVHDLSKEDRPIGSVEQTSDSLRSSAEYLGQSNSIENSNDASIQQDPVTSYTPSPCQNEQEKLLQSTDEKTMDKEECNAQSFSRKRIMSTIAETPELILPEYQSVFTSEKKKPLVTKSCDNIYSGPLCQGSALKNKAQSMLCLLTEYYTTKLHCAENGPFEKVARGCFIRIPKGFQNIQEGVRFQLTLGNCLELLKLARKNSVPDLLKEVYTLISDNYLHVLKNTAIYGQLTGLEREKILQLRMRGKLSLCVIETQSIFGLNKNISCSEDMNPDQRKIQLYSLDMESNQWKQVTNIPEEACLKGCSICSMHNYLFIAGGIQSTKNGLLCSNKLFCYNPLTDIWTQLTPMNQARSQLKLVPLDGYLYAIGGECLHTMERYDPRSNKWTFVASLPKGSFAVAHEAAACGGEIYISGGHLFYRLLKYNPGRDLWEECPFNASKGRSCDMVAVGHILYRFDMHKDSTVHILKYNTTAKVWSEYTATFPNSKVPFRCGVLEGTIYCLNRETAARFSVEEDKAMFESAMFSKVPTKGIGYPCPVMLRLQRPLSQTSV